MNLITAWLIFTLVTTGVRGQMELTLENSITRALENNLTLKSLRSEVEAARLRVKQASTGFLPQISVSSSYTRSELPDWQQNQIDPSTLPPPWDQMLAGMAEGMLPPDALYDTKLQVVLPIFLGGKRFKGMAMAGLDQELKKLQLAAEKKSTVFQIKELYYNLLKLGEAVRISQENAELVKGHLREAQVLMEKGVATKAMVLAIQVQAGEAEQGLLEMENSLQLAKLNFTNLLDLPPGTDIRLLPPAGPLPDDIQDQAQVVEAALAQRPELKQLETVVELARQGVGMARTGFLPNFNVIYQYGWQEEKYEFKDDYWRFIGSMEWNLFAGGSDYLKVKEAKVMVQKAEDDLEKVKRLFSLQAAQAFLMHQQARKAIGVADARLASAQEAYAVAAKSFEQGLINELAEKDARLGLAGARLAQTKAKYDLYIARARLDHAMGVAEWASTAK